MLHALKRGGVGKSGGGEDESTSSRPINDQATEAARAAVCALEPPLCPHLWKV